MARIPRNLLWCSHIHLCIFLWYKRHKVWKRSSLFKGDVATLSASHLASAVLFLLQPFCLAGIYNVFTYVFNGCSVIKTQGKGKGHGTHGLAALVLRGNAFWSDLGVYFSQPHIWNNIIYMSNLVWKPFWDSVWGSQLLCSVKGQCWYWLKRNITIKSLFCTLFWLQTSAPSPP